MENDVEPIIPLGTLLEHYYEESQVSEHAKGGRGAACARSYRALVLIRKVLQLMLSPNWSDGNTYNL